VVHLGGKEAAKSEHQCAAEGGERPEAQRAQEEMHERARQECVQSAEPNDGQGRRERGKQCDLGNVQEAELAIGENRIASEDVR
jgi:hypothetical protein